MPKLTEREALEVLAELEHDQWIYWAKGLLKEGEVITPGRMRRWLKLFQTKYSDLPEEIKEQDRMHARKVMEILKRTELAN